MDIPSTVFARIDAIQARIDQISGADATAPAAPNSFASALQNANAVDPDGQAVRPLDPSAFQSQIQQSAAKYGVDPKLVQAIIQVESDGNPQAVSHAGAMGLMQLMQANVDEAGIDNPFDPTENIDAGTKQLASALGQYGGNLDLALAAYNAGSGAVKKYGGVPPYPETEQYIRKVHALLGDK